MDGSLELDGPVEGKYVGSVEELGFSVGMKDGSFDIDGVLVERHNMFSTSK